MLGIEAKLKEPLVNETDSLIDEYWRLILGAPNFQRKIGRIPLEIRERCLDLEERITANEARLHNSSVSIGQQADYFLSAVKTQVTRIVLACSTIVTHSGIS